MTASACFSARTTSADSASTCSFSRSARCRSSANARLASTLATADAAFNSSICTRSAFALARSSARSARTFVTFKGIAARMGVVARSVPAGAAAEALTGHAFDAGVVKGKPRKVSEANEHQGRDAVAGPGAQIPSDSRHLLGLGQALLRRGKQIFGAGAR